MSRPTAQENFDAKVARAGSPVIWRTDIQNMSTTVSIGWNEVQLVSSHKARSGGAILFRRCLIRLILVNWFLSSHSCSSDRCE